MDRHQRFHCGTKEEDRGGLKYLLLDDTIDDKQQDTVTELGESGIRGCIVCLPSGYVKVHWRVDMQLDQP